MGGLKGKAPVRTQPDIQHAAATFTRIRPVISGASGITRRSRRKVGLVLISMCRVLKMITLQKPPTDSLLNTRSAHRRLNATAFSTPSASRFMSSFIRRQSTAGIAATSIQAENRGKRTTCPLAKATPPTRLPRPGICKVPQLWNSTEKMPFPLPWALSAIPPLSPPRSPSVPWQRLDQISPGARSLTGSGCMRDCFPHRLFSLQELRA